MERIMAPPRKTETENDPMQQGLPPGESSIKTEYPTTADGLEVKGPHNVVDTTPLGDNAPFGDPRAGVLADQPVPGIDPASNLPIEQMDGRIPRPATEGVVTGQTQAGYPEVKHKGRTVELRLSHKYWPKDRPEDLDPAVEYVRHPGEVVKLPEDEAMDLLERGHGERVNKRA